MIQGITNMLKLAYFSQIERKNLPTKQFRRHRPPQLQKYVSISKYISNYNVNKNNNIQSGDILTQKKNIQKFSKEINSYQDISQVCALVTSQQRCQNWIVLIENCKNNYIVQQKLYHSILDATVNVHNLFLMLIQCRVLPDDLWLPIQTLCKLQGDRDNELCCLIHFTVTNMGKKFPAINNPIKWSKQKALKQMGKNFQSIYGNPGMTLQQKISILPMLMVLNNKNSLVLWDRIRWLQNFPCQVIINLRTNMRRLLQERVSVTLSQQNTDYFTSKMCIKSIQLLQVQGFVSGKNLFSYAYQLYSISMLLNLLANYEPRKDLSIINNIKDKQKENMFRLQLIDFLLQLFDCMQTYQYDFEASNLNINSNNNCDMSNIKQIIIKNKLYMQELNNIRFNQELQTIFKCKLKSKDSHNHFNHSIKQKIRNETLRQNHNSKINQATKSFQSWFNNMKINTNVQQKNNISQYSHLKTQIIRQNQIKMQNIQYQNRFPEQDLSLTQTLNQYYERNPKKNINIAKFIPRCNSEEWFNQDSILFVPSFYYESHPFYNEDFQQQQDIQSQSQHKFISSTTPQQNLQLFIAQRQQTILNHILTQLYRLKTDYLQILYAILIDCNQSYSNSNIGLPVEEPWTQNSSIFCKLQLYLIKNFLLDFLVGWFSSIQTKNNPVTMICYYGVIGMLIKGNPIAYGKIDKVIQNIEQQMNNPPQNSRQKIQESQSKVKKSSNSKNSSNSHVNPHLNQIQYLSKSFLENSFLCRQTMFILLGDQFQWKQNQIQCYENRYYNSLLVKRIIQDNRIQWMVTLIQKIVCLLMSQKQISLINSDKNGHNQIEKYQWITFLLTLYYYFEQTMQNSKKQKKSQNNTHISVFCNKKKIQKIDAPNSKFLEKLLQKQKFMEVLYPYKLKVKISISQALIQPPSSYIQFQKLTHQPTHKQKRILIILTQILDKWQQFYNNPKNSKKSILKYNLNYRLLRIYKKKLKNRICGFVKTKQYQQNGQQYYFNFVKSSLKSQKLQ